MFRTARRPIGTLALLLLLAPTMAGCMTTQQAPFRNNPVGVDHITGLTMRSGREIRFRIPGASIVNDTMYAVGANGEVSVPTDSIARIWNRKTSPVRTVGLAVGLAAVGIAIAGAISFGNSFSLSRGSCC